MGNGEFIPDYEYIEWNYNNTIDDKPKGFGLGLTSMILGIVSLIICCFLFLSIALAIVSIILALIVLIKNKGGKGFAIAGLSTSSVALIFCIMALYGSTLPDEPEVNHKSSDTTTTNTQVEKETTSKKPTLEELEQTYKDLCQEYNYKDVMRNPSDYVGKKIKITIEVSTIKDDGEYLLTYSDNDGNGFYFDDEYLIYDKRHDKTLKILEDDILIVYGEIKKPEKLSLLLFFDAGEVFTIDMKYCELIESED